jgi:hypothetical protein
VLAASLGRDKALATSHGNAGLGVRVHITNNEVDQFEVDFYYHSPLMTLKGSLFVDARDCAMGNVKPTKASMGVEVVIAAFI